MIVKFLNGSLAHTVMEVEDGQSEYVLRELAPHKKGERVATTRWCIHSTPEGNFAITDNVKIVTEKESVAIPGEILVGSNVDTVLGGARSDLFKEMNKYTYVAESLAVETTYDLENFIARITMQALAVRNSE